MKVAEHFGVSLDKIYTSAKDGEIYLPLCCHNTSVISLNCPSQATGTLHVCLKRDHADGTLRVDFEIYDARGNRLASVRRNQIVPEQGQDGRYSVVESEDEMAVVENATGDLLLRICRRPKSPDSFGVVLSVRLYLPDGSLFENFPISQ